MEVFNQVTEEQAQQREQGRRQEQRQFNLVMAFAFSDAVFIALILYIIFTAFI